MPHHFPILSAIAVRSMASASSAKRMRFSSALRAARAQSFDSRFVSMRKIFR